MHKGDTENGTYSRTGVMAQLLKYSLATNLYQPFIFKELASRQILSVSCNIRQYYKYMYMGHNVLKE